MRSYSLSFPKARAEGAIQVDFSSIAASFLGNEAEHKDFLSCFARSSAGHRAKIGLDRGDKGISTLIKKSRIKDRARASVHEEGGLLA